MAIRDGDQFLVNRETKSYKTSARDLRDYLGNDGISCDPNGPNTCPPGFICNDGTCVQQPCNINLYPGNGCPPGYECYFGFCYEYCGTNPDLNPGEDCLPGFECVNIGGGTNICVPIGGGGGGQTGCTDDSDCPFPFECVSGTCTPIDCNGAPGNCPPGSDCVDGLICLDQCDSYHPCAPGFTCVDGHCWPIGGSGDAAIGDGRLIFEDSDGDRFNIFSANQKVDSVVNIKGDIVDGGNGQIEINFEGAILWEEADDNESGYTEKIHPKEADVNVVPNGNGHIGTPLKPWIGVHANDLYTGDLHLSNEGKSNEVDGTWGDWTIQEGEDDLYLLNNRTGKKFSFVLKEIK